MEKRYQVFISSTFEDLREERKVVHYIVMKLGHIPAGMEWFPSIAEEQMVFISRIIDASDYYILIIGGRYGSLSPKRLSYTETNFNYAVGKGLKVLVFAHAKPGDIAAAKTEKAASSRRKLEAFRRKARTGRLAQNWFSKEELPGLVAAALGQTLTIYPAIGWVRGNAAASVEILSEINEIRKEDTLLKAKIADRQIAGELVQGLPELDSHVSVSYRSRIGHRRVLVDSSWRQIWDFVSSVIHSGATETFVTQHLAEEVSEKSEEAASIAESMMTKIRLQLRAMNLIMYQNIDRGADYEWKFTERGGSGFTWMRG